jgi:hypothetical protein
MSLITAARPSTALAMRLSSLVVVLLGLASSLIHSPTARAEDVLVCWGDSILAGFDNSGNTTTPLGPAPFGDPLPGAHRWDAATQSWGPVTPYQNYFGTGADPVYGFAAGWRRFHGSEVYVIALAAPGSDASPDHPNPAGSWHPSVPNSLFEELSSLHLTPALASLSSPRIRAVFFTAGNNSWSANFGAHIDDINAAIRSHAPGPPPALLGLKTYLGTPNDHLSLLQRQSIDEWAQTGARRHAVESVSIPGRTGGLVDSFHLTHFGSIYLGFWAAVTERFEL